MALIKGICKNYGECDLADNKEIQEAEKTNFVCEECGKPLHELKSPSTTKLPVKWLMIVAFFLMCGIGAYWYWFMPSKAPDLRPIPEPPIPPHIYVSTDNCTLSVGDSIKVVAEITPYTTDSVLTWLSSDSSVATVSNGVIRAIAKGQATITVRSNDVRVRDARISVNIVTDSVKVLPPTDTNTIMEQEHRSLQGSLPSHPKPQPTPAIDIPDNLEDAINMLVNQSYSREARLNSIPNIINKFFESSAKVRTLGDTGITLDYENVNDFFRRIVLSRRIAEIQLIETEKRNKITEISIQEINK